MLSVKHINSGLRDNPFKCKISIFCSFVYITLIDLKHPAQDAQNLRNFTCNLGSPDKNVTINSIGILLTFNY